MSCDPCDSSYVLELVRGKVNRQSFGYADGDFVYKIISTATQDAPCRITVPSHGLPDDWVVAIEGAKGMTALNCDQAQPKVIDADTLELGEFNALNQPAYTGGGVIKFFKPGDLSGKTAKLSLWRNFGDAECLMTIDLTIDAVNSAISFDSAYDELGAIEVNAGAFGIDVIDADATDKPEEFLTGKFIVLDDGTDG